MNTIQNEWNSYFVSVIPPMDVDKVQLDQSKVAFYTGAKYVMTQLFMLSHETVSEDEAVDTLESLIHMVEEFNEVIGTAREALFTNRMLDAYAKTLVGITGIQRQELRRCYVYGAHGAIHCVLELDKQDISEQAQLHMLTTLYAETLSGLEMQTIDVVQKHIGKKKKKRSGRP